MNTHMRRPHADRQAGAPPLPDTLSGVPDGSEEPDDVPQPDSANEDTVVRPIPNPRRPFIRAPRCGCYLVNYQPAGSPLVSFDGTLRVQCNGPGRTVSGDLYQRPVIFLPFGPGRPPRPILLHAPNPADGIPVLPNLYYRDYIRVTREQLSFPSQYVLAFEMYRYTAPSGAPGTAGTWRLLGSFSSTLGWQAAPAGYPSGDDYMAGDVRNAAGAVVGRLTMGWVSDYLRKATIEIDRVSVSEAPLSNGAAVDWAAIGRQIGWDLTLDESNPDVAEPSGETWTKAECHAAMLRWRDSANLDAEWRYHILCVRDIEFEERGVMYDESGTDSNQVPREGCVLASHWSFPHEPQWGLVQGQRFGASPRAYFRTAVHETGHAMGLYHNVLDNGFMNSTDLIASNSLVPGSRRFPNNIQWSFNADDLKRLRHMPDIYVRPGGIPFGTDYGAHPITPLDLRAPAPDLELRLTPVIEAPPLGAPIRVEIVMTNTAAGPVTAPATLHMRRGFVHGKVIDPAGTVRHFSSLVLGADAMPLAPLAPQHSIRNSVTLLRGTEGSLFPMAGAHQVIIEVEWDQGGVQAVVRGETWVLVTPSVDDAHARAALNIIKTPDVLPALVFGGDHLPEGIAAIQSALDNPVLRPHYAYIEAKRLGTRFGRRRADLTAAAELIDDATVMSQAEIRKAADMIKTEVSDSSVRKEIARKLKRRVAVARVTDDVKELVDAL